MIRHHEGLAALPLYGQAGRCSHRDGDLAIAVANERQAAWIERLYCGRGGRCLVRYDNETGKGDHRHYGTHQEGYRFVSLERLIQDFRADCTILAGWRWE
ncbi:MAG: toxin-antitoxin system TumE family protein [Burkholderiales bacterium]